MPHEPILIVGTGALACLFAAKLAPITAVTMLGSWREGVRALQEFGVRLVDEHGEKAYRVQAVDNPSQCKGFRHALVLVKSWQTEHAAQQLARCLLEDGIALTLQNGYGNLEKLQAALGPRRASLGVTTTGATLLGPGRVKAGGKGATHLVLQSNLMPIASALREADFELIEAHDLDSLVWGKLVINAGINPLTGILGVTNGELLKHTHSYALMKAAAQEAAAVAHALGVDLPYKDPVVQVADVASKTAQNRSSMLQDLMRGAPTEIDAIAGAIVEQGTRSNVPTPVNKILWNLVHAMVSMNESD
jgi:2-dehydropantoate 2-reductase